MGLNWSNTVRLPCYHVLVAATSQPVVQAADKYGAPTGWQAHMLSGPMALGSTCHPHTSPSLAWFSH